MAVSVKTINCWWHKWSVWMKDYRPEFGWLQYRMCTRCYKRQEESLL